MNADLLKYILGLTDLSSKEEFTRTLADPEYATYRRIRDLIKDGGHIKSVTTTLSPDWTTGTRSEVEVVIRFPHNDVSLDLINLLVNTKLIGGDLRLEQANSIIEITVTIPNLVIK